MKSEQIILFDGVCNLCNSSVQFVIEHDKENRFKFASFQSEFGENFLKEQNLSLENFNSLALITENGFYNKSDAAIRIASQLGLPYSFLRVFFILPKFLRDWAYNLVANNRYKLYGKTEACWLPTKELQEKFLV